MTSLATEYAIVPTVGSIHTADVIMGGFDTPALAMSFIVEHGLTRCHVIAVGDGRRFLDGYEVAEVNRSLRLR